MSGSVVALDYPRIFEITRSEIRLPVWDFFLRILSARNYCVIRNADLFCAGQALRLPSKVCDALEAQKRPAVHYSHW